MFLGSRCLVRIPFYVSNSNLHQIRTFRLYFELQKDVILTPDQRVQLKMENEKMGSLQI